MDFPAVSLLFAFILAIAMHRTAAKNASFGQNYVITYGRDHISFEEDRRLAHLSLDRTGGVAFRSKESYGSGFFHLAIKTPENPSPGVVTFFYATSNPYDGSGPHDELHFAFLGSDGPPFVLQTNVYANDSGGRQERMNLWFDPSKDFHRYSILWNLRQIVFFVDNVPIRVYENKKRFGARYPEQPLFVGGIIWNGEAWESSGKKIDWSRAPFQAHYRRFGINGCRKGDNCDSSKFSWNSPTYWQLNPLQKQDYENVRKKYLTYDYCSSDQKWVFKECHF